MSKQLFLLFCFVWACGSVTPKEATDTDIPDIPDMPDLPSPSDMDPIPDFPDIDWFDAGTPDIPSDWEEGTPPDGSPEIRPGLGRDMFSPVRQGDIARWEIGFQGGYHLWVALQIDSALFDGLSPSQISGVKHHYRVQTSSRVLAAMNTVGGFVKNQNGHEFYGGWAVFAPFDLDPFSMDGELLFYRVEIELPGGESFESTVWLKSECCDYF